MAILRRDDTVTDAMGRAISGASVYYLTQPADAAALKPLAPVFSNTTGTGAANPQVSDGTGHAVAYLNDGQLYTIVYAYPNGAKVVYPDQFVGASSGAPTPYGYVPSGAIDGSNTVFHLVSAPSLLILTLNGIQLTPGLGFTRSGTTLTLASAPQAGDTIYAQGF